MLLPASMHLSQTATCRGFSVFSHADPAAAKNVQSVDLIPYSRKPKIPFPVGLSSIRILLTKSMQIVYSSSFDLVSVKIYNNSQATHEYAPIYINILAISSAQVQPFNLEIHSIAIRC